MGRASPNRPTIRGLGASKVAPAGRENGFYAHSRPDRRHFEYIFSVFLTDGEAPKHRWARKNFPLYSLNEPVCSGGNPISRLGLSLYLVTGNLCTRLLLIPGYQFYFTRFQNGLNYSVLLLPR